MYDRPISTSYTVHAAPDRAVSDPETESLRICFASGAYPSVTIFTGDAALASALAAAINGVLAQHKPAEEDA